MRRLLLSCLVLFLSALGASAQFEDSFRWGYGALDMEPGSTGTGNPGKMSVAIFVPMTEALKGAQLKHMYIPVVEDNMQDVKVWAKRSLNDAECIYEKDLSGREFDKEEHYYEFTLSDNSLVVNGDMYIGYTVTSQTGEPFGVSQGSAPGSIYISENGGEFVDYSDKGVGVLALQLFFNNLNLPENNVRLGEMKGISTLCNDVTTTAVPIIINSRNKIQDLEYTVTINGNVQTNTTFANINDIEANLCYGSEIMGTAAIEYTSPANVGTYDVVINITKVNGMANTSTGEPLTIKCENLERSADRRVVMEENTGTGCMWCPRGVVAMKRLAEDYGDKFIGITIHQYNNTDPMYLTNYAKFSWKGAPQCMLNRQEQMDPYFGSKKPSEEEPPVYYAIKDDMEKTLAQLAAADVTVKGVWTSESEVTATADVEFLGTIGKYSIAYVLVADELSGTSGRWLQKNGFFDTTPEESMIPAGDPLAAYCQGGEYGKEYFSMVFNDVAINSSYDADGNNQADALPATFAAGDHATNEYTLALPTQNILLNAINKDKVCVVALVIDENGFIANAARAKVEKADGIESVTEANGHKPMANGTFNLAGQKVNAQYKGVVISGGKKVIVK